MAIAKVVWLPPPPPMAVTRAYCVDPHPVTNSERWRLAKGVRDGGVTRRFHVLDGDGVVFADGANRVGF